MEFSRTTIMKYEGGTDTNDHPTSIFSATINESGAVSLNFELAQAALFFSETTQRDKFMKFIIEVLDQSKEFASSSNLE